MAAPRTWDLTGVAAARFFHYVDSTCLIAACLILTACSGQATSRPPSSTPSAPATPASPPSTSTPTPLPTVDRTPEPSTPPPLQPITFPNGPASGYRGGNATLLAHTSPSMGCSIVVMYKSGPSHAQGLYDKTADAAGSVSWSWVIGTNTTPGH